MLLQPMKPNKKALINTKTGVTHLIPPKTGGVQYRVDCLSMNSFKIVSQVDNRVVYEGQFDNIAGGDWEVQINNAGGPQIKPVGVHAPDLRNGVIF